MIKNVSAPIQSNSPASTTPSASKPQDAAVFKGLLDNQMSKIPEAPKGLSESTPLKFSAHAVERLQSRGINLKQDDIKKLNDAVTKAKDKGSKDALVLMGDNAFVVSVKNNTVVTAMDKNMMKENVFTNIDSTILL